MIEIIGLNPVNTAITAGLESFVSLFRDKTSRAFNRASAGLRQYNATRGILVDRDAISSKAIDTSRAYYFQFNPQTIDDVKETLYTPREYAGLPYNDYIWTGGGERNISFQLFLDNTPQSKTPYFRPTEYGSVEARTIAETKTTGPNFSMYDDVSHQPETLEYAGGAAYSRTRVHERGILPEVDIIRSFMMPSVPIGEELPRFSEGGVVNLAQFRPPPIVVLAIGPLYLEGVVKSAPVTYTLFDEDLTPIRGTIDIEFGVFEYEDISREIDHQRIQRV